MVNANFPPTPTPIRRPGIGNRIEELPPDFFKNDCLYYVVWYAHGAATKLTFDAPLLRVGDNPPQNGRWTSIGKLLSQEIMPIGHYSPGYIEWHDYPTTNLRAGYGINATTGFSTIEGNGNSSLAEVSGNIAISYNGGTAGVLLRNGASMKNWITNWVIPGSAWEFSVIKISCQGSADPPTRITPIYTPSTSPFVFRGNAAPPPPPGKNMCGCDCNTIATIIEERLANQNKQVKDHVDQRTIEQLKSINKMLQDMTIDLDLQPVIDRINEVEATLWNGLGGNN